MEEKDKRYGIIGSIIFHGIILLLLIFFGLQTLPQEEEGILVNFGDTVLGQGEVEPKESQAPPVEQQQTPPPPKVEKVPEPKVTEPESKDEVATQDFDDAPVVKSEAQKKKEKEEQERLDKERREREEQERIEREKELERQRIAAEEEAKRQQELAEQRAREEAERKKREEQERQAAEARNRVSGAFSGKGTGDSSSEGETGGSGNQGYVTGDPNSKNRTGSGLGDSGSGFDLKGRSLIGSLPKPQHNSNKEGIVVIKIIVDRNGNVTSAEFQLKGSNTQDRELVENAKAAARRAKFNADKNASAYAQGTITYYFQLD
ncbi:TonB family protein [Carboxylicivirga sediminis]|uniref:TonB family protein n=1 Tax=Carboxylicivirga sediminis TaxID=2006564 RepID=A0A941F5I0_9BACT|nr:TonB family protein [Carboxylicivirga sediminis]MBR8536303.1 TonB family protein [Carboxylicivirga sediminis]